MQGWNPVLPCTVSPWACHLYLQHFSLMSPYLYATVGQKSCRREPPTICDTDSYPKLSRKSTPVITWLKTDKLVQDGFFSQSNIGESIAGGCVSLVWERNPGALLNSRFGEWFNHCKLHEAWSAPACVFLYPLAKLSSCPSNDVFRPWLDLPLAPIVLREEE